MLLKKIKLQSIILHNQTFQKIQTLQVIIQAQSMNHVMLTMELIRQKIKVRIPQLYQIPHFRIIKANKHKIVLQFLFHYNFKVRFYQNFKILEFPSLIKSITVLVEERNTSTVRNGERFVMITLMQPQPKYFASLQTLTLGFII